MTRTLQAEKQRTPTIEESAHASSGATIDIPPLLEILREIRDELRAVKQQLLARQPSDQENEFLQRFLPAIAGRFASKVFCTRDVLADPILAEVLCPRSAGQLGKLLSRVAKDRIVINGYFVEHLGVENNAALWRILQSFGE